MLNYNTDTELVPRWQRRPRLTMDRLLSDDEMFGLPAEIAMRDVPTLQPRPRIEHPNQMMQAPIAPDAPALRPRVVPETDPYAEYGSAIQPTADPNMPPTLQARPRTVEGQPNIEALPSTPGMRRDNRIEEIQANPNKRDDLPWWKRALIGGLQGVQNANEMVNASRDPRTGQSRMSGGQAAAMIGAGAGGGLAFPGAIAGQMNAQELEGLQGQQVRELKMRGEQANVQQTELENATLRGRPQAEAQKAVRESVEKDLSRLDHYTPGENERLDQRLAEAGMEVTPFDKRKGEAPIFRDSNGKTYKYNRSTDKFDETNLPANVADVPDAEGLTPSQRAGRAERVGNRDAQDEEEYSKKTTTAQAKRNGALESIKQIDSQLAGIDAQIEASKQGVDEDGKPITYAPDATLMQQKATLTNARRQALADKAEADTIINSTPKPERMRMGETMQETIGKKKLDPEKAAQAEKVRQGILAEPDPAKRKRYYEQFIEGMKTLK